MTFAEAQRAIYIDFECVKEKPALLGVLVGSDGEQLGQIITDERLAPAKVANKRCRVAPASAAAGTLVAEAKAGKRNIVGWSFFDRDRLIDACPDRKADINALYVNALQVARPWRQTIHPGFRIEKEDQFAAKHTLDKYAILARYPDAASLQKATPAKWIRHTLAQLEATGGRYRKTTKQTKRDWHDLLEYNRHDCLALRHIVLKASREMDCWRAYPEDAILRGRWRAARVLCERIAKPAASGAAAPPRSDAMGVPHGVEPGVRGTEPRGEWRAAGCDEARPRLGRIPMAPG